MAKAKEKGVKIVLPVDCVYTSESGEGVVIKMADLSTGVPEGVMGLDCGPQSITKNAEAITKSNAIMRNGPKDIMDKIIRMTSVGAITVIGGGDTATACKRHDTEDKVTYCSTDGGASLERLEGKDWPGLSTLDAGAGGGSGKIMAIRARKVFDPRGNPTVEVGLCTESALFRAAVQKRSVHGYL